MRENSAWLTPYKGRRGLVNTAIHSTGDYSLIAVSRNIIIVIIIIVVVVVVAAPWYTVKWLG
ncbi:hypothetical protein RRF57_011650 [Xylaria bambusicola]|uniref:Uncharacterized protein n=1 Tax=Xylaria bambusicola TaxID=326684 RepID=A0AAN7UV93_9PEZI